MNRHVTLSLIAVIILIPALFAQEYLQSVDRETARKVDAVLGNWRGITPEILLKPENADAIPVLRAIAKDGRHFGAKVLLLNISDPEILDQCLKDYRTDGPHFRDSAIDYLEESSNAGIIPLIADDLLIEESPKSKFRAGDVKILPRSVACANIVRGIILNSSVFNQEVKKWADEVPASAAAFREAMRTWWSQNKEHLVAGQYDLVKPPSAGALRTTSISCQDATAPYGGLVTLSATLTDSSLPNHPVITGKSLGFAVSGKSVSNPYEAWLAPGIHPVAVSFAGDSTYGASNATCHLTVQSSSGKITGGGSIGPGQRSFSFVTQTKTKGTAVSYTGNCTFQDAAQNIDLKAVEITGMAVAADRIHGTFVATATNNGVSGFTMTVYLEDRGEPGADKFHLQVSGPNGFSYDSAPQDEGDKVLVGGNIQIHKPQ